MWKSLVIYKEALEILGHKYHSDIQINQTALYLMNEAKICKESEFYYSL